MRASNAAPIQLGLGVLLLLGIFAWAPATFPGYWESINGFVPVFNAGSTTMAEVRLRSANKV